MGNAVVDNNNNSNNKTKIHRLGSVRRCFFLSTTCTKLTTVVRNCSHSSDDEEHIEVSFCGISGYGVISTVVFVHTGKKSPCFSPVENCPRGIPSFVRDTVPP